MTIYAERGNEVNEKMGEITYLNIANEKTDELSQIYKRMAFSKDLHDYLKSNDFNFP